MTNQHDVALNQTACIHAITNWGATTYQNICSGTLTVVPWGTMDYLFGIGVIGLAAFIAVVLTAAIYIIISDL